MFLKKAVRNVIIAVTQCAKSQMKSDKQSFPSEEGKSEKRTIRESEKGLVIVYTGEGKGKTTAALGLILRASGYGKKILLVQFGKSAFSGELKSLKLFKNLKLIRGKTGFVGILGDKKPLVEHQKSAKEIFDKLKKEIISGKWDLVIADEIIGAISGKLLEVEYVLDLIDAKPANVDLVMTGRGKYQEILKRSDLVSEIKSIKHPYDLGIKAKKGIDY